MSIGTAFENIANGIIQSGKDAETDALWKTGDTDVWKDRIAEKEELRGTSEHPDSKAEVRRYENTILQSPNPSAALIGDVYSNWLNKPMDEDARNLYEYNFEQDEKNGKPEQDHVQFENGVINENDLDDGETEESRGANYMTGAEYRRYIEEFGIPGRPLELIDDNAWYNKQYEADHYGFIPYLPDHESQSRYKLLAQNDYLSDAFNTLGDLRRHGTDWTISYNGEQYSGKDFRTRFDPWRTQAEKSVIIPIELLESGAATLEHPRSAVPLASGADGQYHVAGDGEQVTAYQDVPPLILEDGRELVWYDANEIAENIDDYSDYGLFEWAKPQIEDPFEAPGAFLPWIVDLALSSAPYFWIPSSAAKAAGDIGASARGMRPGYQNYLQHTYAPISDDPTEVDRWTAILASAALPVSERIMGPIGGKIQFIEDPTMRALGSILNRVNPEVAERVAASNIARVLTGASDEGIEEIIQNPLEELQQYGLDSYKSPEYSQFEDSDGNPIPLTQPISGREIRRETSPVEMFGNYAETWWPSYMGGAALGGIIGGGQVAANRILNGRPAQFGNGELDPETKKYLDNLFYGENPSLLRYGYGSNKRNFGMKLPYNRKDD